VWERALTTQPAPSTRVVLATAVVAALLVLAPGAWPLARHVVTIAHEAAHGIAALLSGRRLAGIRLHSDTSGLTVSSGRPTGLGMVVTSAAGYVGPAVLGLGAAALLSHGRAAGLLWALLVLLTLLLAQIRNWFGLWSVLVSGGVVFAASWFLPAQWLSAFAYLVAWFLLLAAPRPVLELQTKRWRGQARSSDADQLARLTGVPGLAWVLVFLVVTVGAAVLGGRMLVP
jgi:uncharacterized membrane protein YhaH (DUF805 family)